MKHTLLTILFSALVLSCSDDTSPKSVDSAIVGSWQLIEILADPGDGSGTFQVVKSDKTIDFNAEGTYTINGSICSFSTDTGSLEQGTYETTAENNYTIVCNNELASVLNLSIENDFLIITFFCFEPCQQKYRKKAGN